MSMILSVCVTNDFDFSRVKCLLNIWHRFKAHLKKLDMYQELQIQENGILRLHVKPCRIRIIVYYETYSQ